MPGPPYIPHEKTPKKKENSVPDTRPVCVAPQSDPPSTCAGPVRRAVSGVPPGRPPAVGSGADLRESPIPRLCACDSETQT